ncbi:MAG: lytic transglycosylase domain-containing protein [Xanthobacteraceae bacterium]|nr:lytic transglycosylase domain-containing protein [Xanthobacteraceae bacterium]
MTGSALALAFVSTPAFAGKARHHKHTSHHHVARDAAPGQGAYAAMAARHAAANGIPVSLVHRVIMRESRYNPRAVSKGNYGIMQIRLGTARAMGYTGSAAGLLDPEVNMTYAVKYLAGAYKAAGGSEGGAVSNYAGGYYAQAKRRGLSPYAAPGSATFALQTPTGGYDQQVSYQRATRRGVSSYQAPGYATFAMQTPRRGVLSARGNSYAVAPMTADRHAVF